MSDAAQVWQRLRTVVLEQHDRRHEVCAALGMSFIKIKALGYIAKGPMTLTELTERLVTDRPYTTLVVDDLERRGLAERTVHPDDRRRKIVSITPAGLKDAERARKIVGAPPEPLLALSASELETLDRILGKLVDGPG
ncbi:DNA-binding transcriptional regulator, MarR family [Amycolatopsis xylanica]|uniref:DNA-binding transcriptional regulator, MarR family n=1 Tax=Amycolatopsis xylanica TaxID=589385 RepID=A0A1H3P8H3_9PSEU|nr:MarR family transcriptional regulator [Amycolatopsis xylanica]SDY96689.1 DNA-binding transcriptional regulator, MarR family [Amycolatopsis xylanica]